MAAHALLSPSKSAQWLECPESLAFEHQLGLTGLTGEESSEFADEGTAAHSVGADCLLAGTDAAARIGDTIEVKNEDGSVRRTFVVSEEMAQHVQSYVDEVRRRVGPGDTLVIEQRVLFRDTIGMPFFERDGAPPPGGTADAIIVHADGRVTIIDLKYGAGVRVYAANNTQALCYAVGVLESLGMLHDFSQFKLVIFQPRAHGMD